MSSTILVRARCAGLPFSIHSLSLFSSNSPWEHIPGHGLTYDNAHSCSEFHVHSEHGEALLPIDPKILHGYWPFYCSAKSDLLYLGSNSAAPCSSFLDQP